ncbi:N-acetyltransferase [Dermacoccus nishinomiyaensis]|nr:N-acetyltransferase [Dermacoccus nishinomiyaensis]
MSRRRRVRSRRAPRLIGLRPGQVYFDDPAVVGALGYEALEIAFLVQMWVEPARRGTGVFDALVDAVISDARQQGLRAIGLHAYRANERAAAAYRRRGFRLVENPTAECPADEAEYLLPL